MASSKLAIESAPATRLSSSMSARCPAGAASAPPSSSDTGWSCARCRTFNTPHVRKCQRCWAGRDLKPPRAPVQAAAPPETPTAPPAAQTMHSSDRPKVSGDKSAQGHASRTIPSALQRLDRVGGCGDAAARRMSFSSVPPPTPAAGVAAALPIRDLPPTPYAGAMQARPSRPSDLGDSGAGALDPAARAAPPPPLAIRPPPAMTPTHSAAAIHQEAMPWPPSLTPPEPPGAAVGPNAQLAAPHGPPAPPRDDVPALPPTALPPSSQPPARAPGRWDPFVGQPCQAASVLPSPHLGMGGRPSDSHYPPPATPTLPEQRPGQRPGQRPTTGGTPMQPGRAPAPERVYSMPPPAHTPPPASVALPASMVANLAPPVSIGRDGNLVARSGGGAEVPLTDEQRIAAHHAAYSALVIFAPAGACRICLSAPLRSHPPTPVSAPPPANPSLLHLQRTPLCSTCRSGQDFNSCPPHRIPDERGRHHAARGALPHVHAQGGRGDQG